MAALSPRLLRDFMLPLLPLPCFLGNAEAEASGRVSIELHTCELQEGPERESAVGRLRDRTTEKTRVNCLSFTCWLLFFLHSILIIFLVTTRLTAGEVCSSPSRLCFSAAVQFLSHQYWLGEENDLLTRNSGPHQPGLCLGPWKNPWSSGSWVRGKKEEEKKTQKNSTVTSV